MLQNTGMQCKDSQILIRRRLKVENYDSLAVPNIFYQILTNSQSNLMEYILLSPVYR